MLGSFRPDPPLTAELHTDLRNQIAELPSIEACRNFYDNMVNFQNCINVLRSAQMATTLSRLMWSKEWAESLSQGQTWAHQLNLCRKTALSLLYRVCNVVPPGDTSEQEQAQLEQIVTVFQKRRLDEIIFLCVHMDRSNCLYNMKIPETGERGLGWYGKGDEEIYQNLKGPLLPLNPSGGTINKRLRRLQRGLYTDNDTLNSWLEIAAPERLME